jgi:hypothetical protein
MRTEKSSVRENLDKRADLVNKCIDEKMKTTGTAPPRTWVLIQGPVGIPLRQSMRWLAFAIAPRQGGGYGKRSDAFDKGKEEAQVRQGQAQTALSLQVGADPGFFQQPI